MRSGVLAVVFLAVVGVPAWSQGTTTAHLEVISAITPDVVAPGSPFSIVLDIRPRAGIHVYAPGATGYKVVALNLAANALLVSRPTVYPASEFYFFEPLNERVPVYQKPFRLTRNLAISTAPEHRVAVSRLKTMTVRGTLDYQACDDRACFAPKSIPVSVSVAVRTPDTGRTQ